MSTTTYIPKHRKEPTSKIRLGPIERDVFSIIHAAGDAGIPTDNLRARTGHNPSMMWGALWKLRNYRLVHLTLEDTGYVAYHALTQ